MLVGRSDIGMVHSVQSGRILCVRRWISVRNPFGLDSPIFYISSRFHNHIRDEYNQSSQFARPSVNKLVNLSMRDEFFYFKNKLISNFI